MPVKPVVGIYRHTLLPPSEVFIAELVSHLPHFHAHYFGREAGEGQFDLHPCHLIQERQARFTFERVWYTLTGLSPTLERAIGTVAPALLHAQFGVEGVYALRFARHFDLPLVTHIWGFDATRHYKALIASGKPAWIRYVLGMAPLKRHGTLFLAVSEFIRQKLVNRGFPADRTLVLYTGVNLQRLKPADAYDDGRTVLTIGRLVEKKGTADLIRAIARLQSRIPDVRLEIIGDGPLRASLMQLATSLGVRQRITFHGATSHAQVIEAMQRTAVFCLPSVTAHDGDAEGLPNALLEAEAAGKPVVGSVHGGIPEAIRDGQNGFLVAERDVEALAERLWQLLEDRELRRHMGYKSRRLVEQDFDISTQARRLEEIYLEAIRQHRQHRA
jgi:colanic acid/amylovoran biosynthesis glycosyltransferase